MNDRFSAIYDLLEFRRKIEELRTSLSKLSWDYSGAPQEMSLNQLRIVLERYVGGELSTQDVEDWANLIEGREDIIFQQSEATALDKYIYELANPTLTEELSIQRAAEIILLIDKNR